MTRFFVLFVFTLAMAVSAGVLTANAYAWIELGRGLHPMVAMPIATLCVVFVALAWLWFSDSEDDNTSSDDTQMFIDGCGRRHYQ